MNDRRVLRVQALLHAALDRYLQRSVEFPRGVLVTISQVLVSDDLSHARILVSVLPVSCGAAIVRDLNAHAGAIRHALRKELTLRIVPKPEFVEDEREERAERINRLLDESDGAR